MSKLEEEIGLSEHQREMKRWDYTKRDGGTRPDGFQEYPKMLYRTVTEQGRRTLDDQGRCRIVAQSAEDEQRMRADGWRLTKDDALAANDWEQEAVANAAAEKAAADRKMSATAQREAAAVEQAAGASHVPEHPESKRRG